MHLENLYHFFVSLWSIHFVALGTHGPPNKTDQKDRDLFRNLRFFPMIFWSEFLIWIRGLFQFLNLRSLNLWSCPSLRETRAERQDLEFKSQDRSCVLCPVFHHDWIQYRQELLPTSRIEGTNLVSSLPGVRLNYVPMLSRSHEISYEDVLPVVLVEGAVWISISAHIVNINFGSWCNGEGGKLTRKL